MKKLLLLLSLLSTLSAQPTMQQEIDHLLHYVASTECTYIRNGEGHDGKEAHDHILRKYRYFKDDIKTTEDFIRLSATGSLMFKNKYYIQCPGEKKVESAIWLKRELQRFREEKK